MNILGIIPARYASTRFPGKPLVPIAGKPLIRHVVDQCRKAWTLCDVIVATDDERIAAVVRDFCRVEMTSPDHPSGTDRIAEVAQHQECDGVVNVQGDEPMIDPETINAVASALTDHEMATAATPLQSVSEYENPNVVKVVFDRHGRALYFSRHAIPYLRDADALSGEERLQQFPFMKHLGIYAYRHEILLELVRRPISSLENAEKLEQLRALENGIGIGVMKVAHEGFGVDAPEDVARIEVLMSNRLEFHNDRGAGR